MYKHHNCNMFYLLRDCLRSYVYRTSVGSMLLGDVYLNDISQHMFVQEVRKYKSYEYSQS